MLDAAKLEKFHTYIGDVIMSCQRIEYDIKLIYAGMREGDIQDNMRLISKNTLGETLILLMRLDNSDDHPFFSSEDYKYLKKLKNIRNYWVHNGYVDFLYEDDDDAFYRVWNRLQGDREHLVRMRDVVEDVRIEVMKKFGRI